MVYACKGVAFTVRADYVDTKKDVKEHESYYVRNCNEHRRFWELSVVVKLIRVNHDFYYTALTLHDNFRIKVLV